MRPAVLLLSAVGAAMAADVCGPGSNCEFVVNRHGRNVTRFREGMGPGSEDYARRFGTDTARLHRRADITTDVTVGDTEMGYYCGDDASIDVRDYVVNALNTLCSDTGCDEGSEWTVPSEYVADESYVAAEVAITAEGTYPSGMMVHFVDAVGAIPDNGAVTTKDMTYFTWGAVPKQDTCTAKRMANYAKVAKFDGVDLVGSIDFSASLTVEDTSGACETVAAVLGAIAGAVSGIAGGFFGVVGAICSA